MAGLSIAVLLAGCTVGPDFQRPDPKVPALYQADGEGGDGKRAPDRRRNPPVPSRPAAEPVDPDWWNRFNDTRLTVLIRRVAAENLDIKAALSRVAQSRAQLGVVRSFEFPTLDANGSYTRQKASNVGVFGTNPNALGASGAFGSTAGGLGSRQLGAFDVFQMGFDASWEVDLWGGVKRSVESADAAVEATEEATRGVLVTALAETARDYITLRGVQTRLSTARESVEIARQSVLLTQQRATGGVTTDLDVANATTQLRLTAALVPGLEQQEAALINAISFLMGQPPRALRAELDDARPIPPVPPSVPIGVPSELARRRPDIRQAEAELHAATADIGVAVAAFYPSVRINGSLGLQALQIGRLFDLNAREYAAGPGIRIPLFDAGRLNSTLQVREARQQDVAIQYQKTVLRALQEVDDALTAYRAEQVRRAELIEAVKESTRALGIAQSRYRLGVADFLSVLDAQRNMLVSRQLLADSTTTVSTNLVALYKALGGGWETDFPDEPRTQPSGIPMPSLLER